MGETCSQIAPNRIKNNIFVIIFLLRSHWSFSLNRRLETNFLTHFAILNSHNSTNQLILYLKLLLMKNLEYSFIFFTSIWLLQEPQSNLWIYPIIRVATLVNKLFGMHHIEESFRLVENLGEDIVPNTFQGNFLIIEEHVNHPSSLLSWLLPTALISFGVWPNFAAIGIRVEEISCRS